MAAGAELRAYVNNLDQARANVGEVREVIEHIDKAIDVAQLAIQAVDAVEQRADAFGKTLQQMKLSLKLMDKAGPLKAAAKAGLQIVDKLEDAARQIERKAHDLAKAIDDKQIEQKLDKAEHKLQQFDRQLDEAGTSLQVRAAVTAATVVALDTVDALDPNGDPAALLSLAADRRVAVSNAQIGALNAVYGAVRDTLGFTEQAVPASSFQPVVEVRLQFDKIAASLDVLRGPLNVVSSVLKPVEPLLNAVGFVFDVTVGPVINYLVESLGIRGVVDAAAERIAALLPSPAVLDTVLADFDRALAELGPLGELSDAFGISDWVDDLRAELIGDLGDAAGGPLGLGNDGPDTLVGDGDDELFDAGAGNDRIDAGGGHDVLVAGPGHDTLLGGPGHDTVVFAGHFAEYRFVHDAATGTITFDHAAPATRTASDGVDETRDIEVFAFKDFQLSRDTLLSAVRVASPGQTLLQGGSGTDLLFAGATAITLEGLGGDDVLYGSPQADVLRGGDGNDMLVRSAGNDTLDGGPGVDTWRFGVSTVQGNPSPHIDLRDGTGFIGRDRVAFAGIENVVVEYERPSWLFGDDGANRLVSSGQRDVLDGRGGNDRLEGGQQDDVLIGGPGADSLYGGDGFDVLAAADTATAGQANHYDGGAGDADVLTYQGGLIDWLRREHIDDLIRSKAASQAEVSGPVRVLADQGVVERLSADGRSVVATDSFTGIETVVGSNGNDELHAGSRGTNPLHTLDGGPGNDVLYAEQSDARLQGGDGDDRIVGGTGGFSAFGGQGFNTLDLSTLPDVRWLVRVTSLAGNALQSFDAREGSALAEPGTSLKDDWGAARLGGGNVGVFQRYLGGPRDDHFEVQGYDGIALEGGGGDDFLMGMFGGSGSVSFQLLGGEGRDHLVLQDIGTADGGVDDDLIEIDAAASARVRAVGGSGDDVIRLRSGNTTVEGGEGIDTLAAAARNARDGFNVDLNTGYLSGFNSPNNIWGSVSGIEIVLGANGFSNRIIGSRSGDQLVGGDRGDLLMGGEGADALYGGPGNDEILAEWGDDLLHGGDGSDRLDGGDGIDTASWAWFAPAVQPGELARTTYAGVRADLASGYATVSSGGVVATDTLVNIENLIGSNGDDVLIGDDTANLLAGGGGRDLLTGLGGNDVLVLEGDDAAQGGDGDDRFVVGHGNVQVEGGAGFDTLDFGSLSGQVTLDLAAGTWLGLLDIDRPVWADDGGTQPRSVGGVTLTPQQVFEADPVQANSPDDATRVVPDDTAFRIRLDTVREAASGRFTGVEAVTGGNALFEVQLDGPRTGFAVQRSGSEASLAGVGNGSMRVDGIERLRFTDQSVAFDLDGDAGHVAKLLGAVFGPDAVHNPAWVGIGLSYLAQGPSVEDLGAAALQAAGATTPEAVVDRLWTAIVGTAPSTAQAAPYVQLLLDGLSPGALAVAAGNLDVNAANIGLAGLMEAGLVYDALG
jgi:Ca2+-binding RTX toxin-like protein